MREAVFIDVHSIAPQSKSAWVHQLGVYDPTDSIHDVPKWLDEQGIVWDIEVVFVAGHRVFLVFQDSGDLGHFLLRFPDLRRWVTDISLYRKAET